MAVTLGFDVYGTLIDTQGVTSALERYVGPEAAEFALLWRTKQLEYSFRRGLMRDYRNFAVCTGDALKYACLHFGRDLGAADRQLLMEAYAALPPFDDVREALERTTRAGFRCYAFSNGSRDAVDALLRAARIREYFLDVVSVDEIGTFKPNPDVYRHFLKRTGATGEDAWLVSSNPFDVIGAIAAGMRAAWVRRSPAVIFDPWGVQSTITIETLSALPGAIMNAGRA